MTRSVQAADRPSRLRVAGRKLWARGVLRAGRRKLPYVMDRPTAYHYLRRAPGTPQSDRWNPGRDSIPPRRLWGDYGRNTEEYLASGRRDVDTMLRMLEDVGYSPAPGASILDFGCQVGRMLRWLPIDRDISYWGVDTDGEVIRFCEDNFPQPPFRFAVTTEIPHLPFCDGEFDLVIAGSVFTHIDDLAMAWFSELRRVLAPEGYLYLTIHDENTLRLLRDPGARWWLADHLRSTGALDAVPVEDFDMFSVGRGPDAQVFHRREWLTQRLHGLFDVKATTLEAYGCYEGPYQTGLVLRRR